jgi:signal transduction histidine kinase
VSVREAAELARERFAGTARAAGRTIAVEADPAVRVSADSDRFAQMLDALIDNALSHGAGTVTISAAAQGASVALHVTDEGPGFPADFRERAFDRFATADTGRAGAANGLGLAIVAALAEAHGGTASAANRPGGGADVWAELPSASPAAHVLSPGVLSRSGSAG